MVGYVRISAPPIAAVVVNPLMKLSAALAPRYAAAINGIFGAKLTNAPMVSRFAPSSELLMRCRPGSARGLEDILPASLKKATTDPVNVTPPMRTPRYAVTRCRVSACWTSERTLAILVKTAARPTTEWSAATICGSSIAVMRRPMTVPMPPPIAATAANWMSVSGEKPTAAKEARIPETVKC